MENEKEKTIFYKIQHKNPPKKKNKHEVNIFLRWKIPITLNVECFFFVFLKYISYILYIKDIHLQKTSRIGATYMFFATGTQ